MFENFGPKTSTSSRSLRAIRTTRVVRTTRAGYARDIYVRSDHRLRAMPVVVG